jgi:peptide-methionine (S)-S-oxide reductase
MALFTKLIIVLSFVAAIGCGVVSSSTKNADLKDLVPVAEPEVAADKGLQTAVFAGGCFWGVDAVFKHVKGVTDVKSGYSGGEAKTAKYDLVSEGDTGHAESVQVTFDSTKVTYNQLLEVFFKVAHDPTELNRQGPDTGTQYRSAIFYADDTQQKAALDYIQSLSDAKAFTQPIVTEVTKLKAFYPAEAYHQNYLARHPDQPYIVVNDAPKVEDLKKRFPGLYTAK